MTGAILDAITEIIATADSLVANLKIVKKFTAWIRSQTRGYDSRLRDPAVWGFKDARSRYAF
jgi:hypothetical protein